MNCTRTSSTSNTNMAYTSTMTRERKGDGNEGFLDLLEAINEFPTIVEPHTVHGRLTDFEANFVYKMCERARVVLFKCHYQKWRLEWNFVGRGWQTPRNVMVVPHGARPDKRWGIEDVPALREELGLDKVPDLSKHLVGMVGWIQSNKRWDILTSMWEDIHAEILDRSGHNWDLLAAGSMRDPNHLSDFNHYREQLKVLEGKGIAHYFEFVPRGEIYYKVMAVCDFHSLAFYRRDSIWNTCPNNCAQQTIYNHGPNGGADGSNVGKWRRVAVHQQGNVEGRGDCDGL